MRFVPLLLAAGLLAGCSRSDTDKPVWVGHVHPAGPDDEEFRALSLAVEDLNRDIGTLPQGRRIQVRHAPRRDDAGRVGVPGRPADRPEPGHRPGWRHPRRGRRADGGPLAGRDLGCRQPTLRPPLRWAAGRARARHAASAPRSAAAGDRRAPARLGARARGAHALLRGAAAARRVRRGQAVADLRRVARRHGLRFRARPARPFDASVHDDGRRARRAPHDSHDADDPLRAIFATLHEGGHALYDQGVPRELHGTLLADAPSMGVHESQARLWENHVGRSAAFWRCYFGRLRDAFPDALRGLDARSFHCALSVVAPGTNRVAADEATYNLHVLVRYELEIALLDGELAAADLPAAWDERYRRYLGVSAARPRDGCLQDVHWALGEFGYFPTYTIGNLYAAQLVDAYDEEHDLDAELEVGNLSALRVGSPSTCMSTVPSCRPKR